MLENRTAKLVTIVAAVGIVGAVWWAVHVAIVVSHLDTRGIGAVSITPVFALAELLFMALSATLHARYWSAITAHAIISSSAVACQLVIFWVAFWYAFQPLQPQQRISTQ